MLLTFLISLITLLPQEKKQIVFESDDGLEVTADLYMTHDKSAPFIVLFHMARSSRGEYIEIAPRLNRLGFNCMAVDLRSGGASNGVQNVTYMAAEKAMKATQYINAYADIDAAVNYAQEYLAEGKLIIWGSSYSSSLVIRYAGDHQGAVNAVMAFSPGEYFRNQGKSATYVTQGAAKVDVPVFITSAKHEKSSWWKIYEAIPVDNKVFFLPETAGNHGSQALWSKFGDSLRYWDAVEKFLKSIN